MKTIEFPWPHRSELFTKALALSKTLRDAGFQAYWAGGCVRDALLGRQPKDIDIATNATPDSIQKLFPKNVDVGKQFGVIIVPEDGAHFEIATFRKDGDYKDGRHPENVTFSSPEVDASRRDFTINALFWDPFQSKIIDYVGGLDDLSKKTIRAIGKPLDRFNEDKLRMMRAIRFSAEFDYPIDPETSEAIRFYAANIHSVSAERIRDELIKMWTGRAPHLAMERLSEHLLLREILPEIEAFKGVEQPPEYHPEGDVWTHVMLMLSFCSYAPLELVLGVLFHDIAKPQTFERAADRIRFHGHQKEGVPLTKDILTRLKFSNRQIQLAQDLVSQHMRFGDTHKMKPGRLRGFVMQEDFPLHLELHRIDCLGSHRMLENYELCKQTLEEIKNLPQLAEPLITGRDLIALGLKPGPEFKIVLDQVREAQLEGRIQNRDEALDFVRKLKPQI